jgi:YD repeat-containing protein
MADGDQGTHALPPLVVEQPKSRQQQGTGDTDAKGNASCQLGVGSCAKPEPPFKCARTPYQNKLAHDAQAVRNSQTKSLISQYNDNLTGDLGIPGAIPFDADEAIKNGGINPDQYFSQYGPNLVRDQFGARSDGRPSQYIDNINNQLGRSDASFLNNADPPRTDDMWRLAFMDATDIHIKNLEEMGAQGGDVHGYDEVIKKWCERKKQIDGNTQLSIFEKWGVALEQSSYGPMLKFGAETAESLPMLIAGARVSVAPETVVPGRTIKPPPNEEIKPPTNEEAKQSSNDKIEPPPSDKKDDGRLKPKDGTAVKGEPVDVTNGEYLETWEDFLIPGTIPFDGSRYMGLKLGLPGRYRSPLGPCQISAFDEIVYIRRKGELTYVASQGEEIVFERPFNYLDATNPAYPTLSLTAPWLGRLDLEDRRLVKHFRQYRDKVYRLEAVETLDGRKAVFTRSEAGVLQRIDGPDGLSLAFDNDDKGRRTAITLIGTDGSRLELARYGYDSAGRMASADCAFGMSVRYAWRKGDLLESWHNLSQRSRTLFSYDEAGRVVHTATTGLWNDDRFRYDPAKRQSTYAPAGDDTRAERFAYDENRNVTAETNALGAVTSHTYDEYGRLTATKDANGHAVARLYDGLGNIQSVRDAEGRETFYAWGNRATLLAMVDNAGHIRRFDYDGAARPVSFTDAEGHVTRFGYDDKGRLVSLIRPDGHFEQRSYDEYNRLIRVTDARGGQTSFAHDAFGRVIAVRDAGGGGARLAYEAGAGGFAAPTTLTRPDGIVVSRAHDVEGTLSSVTDGEGRRWTYEHGAFGVLKAVGDPKGGRLTFEHDSEGRLVAVTNARGQVWRFERDAAGQVVAEEDFDGRRIAYGYDPAGRLTERRHGDGARQAYAYDKSGLLIREDSFEPGEAYPSDVTRY